MGRNLTHGLFDALGRAIVRGEYDHLDLPSEAELARRFSVSRAVAREAVKMLTAKGLVSARPRRGTEVQRRQCWNLFDPDVLRWMMGRSFSIDLLRHFTEMRIAVEPAAAGLAASIGEPTRLARVDQGYRRIVAAGERLDEVPDASISFHVAVLEASGNPFFLQLRNLVTMALRTQVRFANRFETPQTVNLPAYKAVRDAIFTGDAVEARHAMSTIIREVIAVIGTTEEVCADVDADRGGGR